MLTLSGDETDDPSVERRKVTIMACCFDLFSQWGLLCLTEKNADVVMEWRGKRNGL